MHETPGDLAELQALLDRSYTRAGPHLLEIHTPERRLTAGEVVERLQGVCVLSLATVFLPGPTSAPSGRTAAGRPSSATWGPCPTAAVVAWLGFHPVRPTGSGAVRVRHIARNPAVSGTYAVGESLAVTIHGDAVEVDLTVEAGFADACRSIYGEEWSGWGGVAPYYRIRPRALFSFWMGESDVAPP